MNHTQAIREIMILNEVSLVDLAKHFGITHVGVMNRINTKGGRVETILQILEAMGYEMVIRPQTEGEQPEGEYALRPRDYPSVKVKRDELL